jgi:hypothetical protein
MRRPSPRAPGCEPESSEEPGNRIGQGGVHVKLSLYPGRCILLPRGERAGVVGMNVQYIYPMIDAYIHV